MAKRIIPTRIVRMINTRYTKGQNAKQIAKSVNSSATAKKLRQEYSHRTVAAIMANITMGNYTDL